MKKILSILALVLAMTMVMSVSAFATAEFSLNLEEGAELPTGVTVTDIDADSFVVTAPATEGKYYSVLLIDGEGLPTVNSSIGYINQTTAETGATTVSFDVLPLLTSVSDECTLYIGTNGTEGLVTIPMMYAEPAAEGYPTGDVNNDGAWDSLDAVKTLRIGLDLIDGVTAAERTAADVNEDGACDSIDAVRILRYGLGLIDTWK